MARQLRVAICQLQSHPLVIVGDRNISAEPFFPEKGVSLADLARHSLDVSRLQERFFARYLDWQSQRILAIIRYLEQMTPVPDIVVFPEGAVPLESLYELRDFAGAKAVTVFAGTHSFRVTSNDFAHYKALGVRNSELKGWEKGRAGTAILPIVTPTGCTFRLKHHSSVFEVTGIATHVPSLDPVDVVAITARGNRYDILPLVCADALHMPNTRGAYSVVVIVAYNRVIDPFLPLIEQNTFNRIPVLLCNDGQFGGSCVAVRQDVRMDTWWWSSPRSGRLSPGDALLVVDIDMDSLAPQVSVANPHAAAQLVSISDVVATAGVSPAFAVSQRLADIRSNTDNFVQADLLDQCISQLSPSQIQRDKIQQLRRLALQGTADSSWWDALASTCTVDGLPDLGILESDFAKECVESLDPLVSQATVSDDTALGKLVRFLKRCRDRCHPATDPTSPATTLEISVHALIDREYETKTIRQFLDSRNEAVLIVTGLDSVGKTTVFDATLAQAGRVRTVTVTLVDDSSPDFIAEALARSLRLPRSSSTDVATVERITDAAFPDNVSEAFRELMHEAAGRVPEPPAWTHERGIVICGGGWRFFPSLFVTIACIRRTGCTLPIQVWFLGDRGEFDLRMLRALEPFQVGWICGNSFCREHGIPRRLLGGWELKPLAAAYCPYKEVLSLDADSYPAYNPEIFMDHPEFRRVGAAFWPDQGKLEPGQWKRFGMPYHDEAAWESGQFIVDKSRHWKPLWFTCWMNDHSDYVYKHVYGDKDTFHLSWRFCGHDVCVPTQIPGWHICAFIQMDFAGNCLFCHRTRDKFRWPGGHIDGQEVQNAYMTGQWYGHVERIPGLPHEDFAHDMLQYSDELLRPELHFQFIDGPAGWCRALWDQVYLANEYAVPPQFADSDVILDIGAHVGAFTRACLRRGAGHVLAVEPLSANVTCLQHNIGGYENRVTIRNVAAWDTDTTLVLNEASCHEPGNTSTFSAFLPAAEQGWEVQAVSIDTLINEACSLSARGRVRLLKIDAEGAEYPTLLTAEKLHLVDEICGESHNNVPWQDELPGIAGLTRRLEQQGFVVTHIDNGPNTSIFWARRQPC